MRDETDLNRQDDEMDDVLAQTLGELEENELDENDLEDVIGGVTIKSIIDKFEKYQDRIPRELRDIAVEYLKKHGRKAAKAVMVKMCTKPRYEKFSWIIKWFD